MRTLDPNLRAEIQAFRCAYVGHFPDFLFPRPDEKFLGFEQELAFLHDLEPETLAFEFLAAPPFEDLRLLARAGVLESSREGYYVLYSLAPAGS